MVGELNICKLNEVELCSVVSRGPSGGEGRGGCKTALRGLAYHEVSDGLEGCNHGAELDLLIGP